MYGTVIDSYTESHKDGFALDAIVGLPLTVGGHEATNVIKLYYKDVYGEDGEKSDGIPDKYQTIVRYRIVDGTWNVNGSGSADIVQCYTLYTGNASDGWTLKDPAPTLKDIPGGTGNTGYQANGQWDHRFDDKTAVTKDVTYTLSFDHIHYTISAQVFNGTAEVDGETFVSPYEYHYDDKETTTIVFAPFAGYVLEKVEVDGHDAVLTDNSYTFKHNDGNHSITVVYAEDTNNNGTPDKYEATVTFYVVNGTWADKTADAISHVFALYAMDDSGVWQPLNPTLGNTVPTGMIAAAGYHGGEWNTGIGSTTPVTRNASYTFSFSLDYYLINAVVINGSARVGDEPFEAVTVPYSATGKTKIDFAPNDDENHHYIVESVTVDEKLLNLNVEELKNFSSYEFDHLNNHHIRVAYALDNNRDNIPDKYQKKVTFRIIHGTWDDDRTVEKTIYENLLKDGVFDTAGSAVVTEPEYKKIPAAGFVGGEWDVTFPQTVTGTDEIVYTYTFNQKQQIQIIIEVLGGTSHPVHSDTVYDYDETDHEIAFKANEGYVFDSAKVKEGDLEQAQLWRRTRQYTPTPLPIEFPTTSRLP